MPMLCDYCCSHHNHALGHNEDDHLESEKSLSRNLFYGTSNRVSDDASVKRGELLRIRALLKKRLKWGNDATRFHYQDLLLRIEEALTISIQK